MNIRKVAMIGCGFVGSASVFALMQSGLFSEIVMIDVDNERAMGEAMDISHGVPFVNNVKIYAGDYKDCEDAGIIIITAGAAQKENETRLDLVKKNKKILQGILALIDFNVFEGILLIVSNPVDVLTYEALKLSKLPENRVIGSGTVLDTARLKYVISQKIGVDSKNISAFIIGEHGDSETVAWECANIMGVKLEDYSLIKDFGGKEEEEKIAKEVKNFAYEIIKRKKATYYGVAMSIKCICEAIVLDEKTILPVSHVLHGEYGISDVALSLPCVIGKNGIEGKFPLRLNSNENKRLINSAHILKKLNYEQE